MVRGPGFHGWPVWGRDEEECPRAVRGLPRPPTSADHHHEPKHSHGSRGPGEYGLQVLANILYKAFIKKIWQASMHWKPIMIRNDFFVLQKNIWDLFWGNYFLRTLLVDGSCLSQRWWQYLFGKGGGICSTLYNYFFFVLFVCFMKLFLKNPLETVCAVV